MKFELKPFSRRTNLPSHNLSSQELLDDLRNVAERLNELSVTSLQYREFGKYGCKALVKRFGQSWFDVLRAAGMNPTRSRLNISTDEMLEDVKRIALLLNKQTLTQQEYEDGGGKFSCSAISKRFGRSWIKAVESIGLKRSREFGVTDEEYFHNLEKIWLELGRQPLYREIEKPFSNYSVGAYEAKFGSWRKALEAFVTYMNTEDDEPVPAKPIVTAPPPQTHSQPGKNHQTDHKTVRQVSERLRFRVFYRDGMTCQICGKTRTKYPDLELVVDHVCPWSKGGETVFDNLQTLCKPCNGGKDDLGHSELIQSNI